MHLFRINSKLGIALIAIVTLMTANVAISDAEVQCPKTGCDFLVEAELVDEVVLRLHVSNRSTKSLEFLSVHFEPGLLRLLVVDKFGDLVERFSWIGDSSTKSFVIEPYATHTVDVVLFHWYENLEQRIESWRDRASLEVREVRQCRNLGASHES